MALGEEKGLKASLKYSSDSGVYSSNASECPHSNEAPTYIV